MRLRTYLRFKTDHPSPEPFHSGAGGIASLLAAGLRTRGFSPSEPKDQEFAHFIRCPSGLRRYEIMVAFDFVEGHTWEVSCPPLLGFCSRLFGQTEEKELSALIKAIHDTIQSDPHMKEMYWYHSYADTLNASSKPIEEA